MASKVKVCFFGKEENLIVYAKPIRLGEHSIKVKCSEDRELNSEYKHKDLTCTVDGCPNLIMRDFTVENCVFNKKPTLKVLFENRGDVEDIVNGFFTVSMLAPREVLREEEKKDEFKEAIIPLKDFKSLDYSLEYPDKTIVEVEKGKGEFKDVIIPPKGFKSLDYPLEYSITEGNFLFKAIFQNSEKEFKKEIRRSFKSKISCEGLSINKKELEPGEDVEMLTRIWNEGNIPSNTKISIRSRNYEPIVRNYTIEPGGYIEAEFKKAAKYYPGKQTLYLHIDDQETAVKEASFRTPSPIVCPIKTLKIERIDGKPVEQIFKEIEKTGGEPVKPISNVIEIEEGQEITFSQMAKNETDQPKTANFIFKYSCNGVKPSKIQDIPIRLGIRESKKVEATFKVTNFGESIVSCYEKEKNTAVISTGSGMSSDDNNNNSNYME